MRKRRKFSEAELPSSGSVFLAPLEDGRFGVVRVLRTKTEDGYCLAFVVSSSWIGNSPSRPSDRDIRLPLILTHHSWAHERQGLWVGTPPPPSFIPVGSIKLTAKDHAFQQEVYAGWEALSLQILLQWRWENDRESVLQEDAIRRAREAEERRIADTRRAELLRTVTLDGVSNRTWFDTWDEESDGPNLSASRRLISDLIDGLRTPPKLTKAIARRLVRAAVKDFNRLDTANQFIETTHREDICEAFEIITAAARYPELFEEVESLRDW